MEKYCLTVEEGSGFKQNVNNANLYVDVDYLYSVVNYLDLYLSFFIFPIRPEHSGSCGSFVVAYDVGFCWVKMVTQKL